MSDDTLKTMRSDLSLLHQAASSLEGWRRDQAREFIHVGEYGLALDGIAHAYLTNHKIMPAELFRIFEKLAVAMDMAGDPEFEGVARLRAAAMARAQKSHAK